MTTEIKRKATSFGKGVIIAALSGSLSFAWGSIQSVGEYKEKVNSLESWRDSHQKIADSRIAELEEVKRKQEVMIFEIREANKKLDRLEQKFDQRWTRSK